MLSKYFELLIIVTYSTFYLVSKYVKKKFKKLQDSISLFGQACPNLKAFFFKVEVFG